MLQNDIKFGSRQDEEEKQKQQQPKKKQQTNSTEISDYIYILCFMFNT